MRQIIRFADKLLRELAQKKLYSITAFFLLGFIIYSNVFNAPFVFDDKQNILRNDAIRHIDSILSWWGPTKPRIIGYLSFAINYKISGFNVVGYHLTNIFIHIITTILVWRLILVTFQTPNLKNNDVAKHKKKIALFAALIFLTHPIQTQAVTYIVQRFASLATLFYVLSIYLYTKARISKKYYYFAGAIVSSILGFFTKEIAFTIPLMILTYEFYFFGGFKKTIRSKSFIYWLLLFAFIVIFISLTYSRADTFSPVHTFKGELVTSSNYLITQFGVFIKYVKLLIIPVNQSIDHFQPVLNNLRHAEVILGIFSVVLLLVFAVITFKKYRLLSFSILWFFIAMIPESSVIVIKDAMVEHRLYLPMVGFSLFSVLSIYYLFQIFKNKLSIIWAFLLLMLILAYSVLTFQRNQVWRNEINLWKDVIKKDPENSRAITILGILYFKNNDLEDAERFSNNALLLHKDNPDALNNLGAIYGTRGQFDEALVMFNKTLQIDPNHISALSNKAALFYKQGKLDEAAAIYKVIIELSPNNTGAYEILSYVLTISGKDDEAKEYINKAIKIDPSLKSALKKIELLKKNRKK